MMNIKIISTNPSDNYNFLGEVEVNSLEEIKEKIKYAKIAQKNWEIIDLESRVKYLTDVYYIFATNKEVIAKSISQEMGMPIFQARDEVVYGMNYFSWYLENAINYLSPEITMENDKELHTVFYEAKGLVVAIAPWNYPFSMFVWTCIQALLSGNSVIFKTSKETILTGKIISDLINKTSLSKGVWNEIFGDGSTGDLLINEDGIDFVTFTGSTNVGRSIQKRLVEKGIGCVMELGGSAPGIIFEDSNIDEIIDTIYFLRYSNSGQMCDGLKRLIVHESKYDEVVEKLIKVLKTKNIGNSLDEKTDIGPLVSEKQLTILIEQYNDAIDKGANIIYSGNLDKNLKGAYFYPTILGNISLDMKVWKEEVFGPILPIVKFKSIQEAIELANDTKYGLGAYVFTQDKDLFKTVAKEIKSGMIQLNNLNYCIPQNPFGGYKNSGVGREHGKWGFAEFTNVKVISMNK